MAAPIITAYWSENANDVPSYYAGWKIELCAKKELLDCTRFGFQWKSAAPYMIQYDTTGVIENIIGLGPKVWTLNPDEEPSFRKENGAQRQHPPMHQIIQCVAGLAELGYSVTACNSTVFGIGSCAHISWFLQVL